jgi:hypothetical protein
MVVKERMEGGCSPAAVFLRPWCMLCVAGRRLQNAFGWNLSGDFTPSAVLSRDGRYSDTRRTHDAVQKAQTRHSNSTPPVPKMRPAEPLVLPHKPCPRLRRARGKGKDERTCHA